MHTRTRTSALAAALFVGLLGTSIRTAAQQPAARSDASGESTPHFALFGGWAPLDGQFVVRRGLAMGGSADFRWSPLPVPLRLSLSFDERGGEYISKQRGGQAALDLVMRPVPKLFGMQPYFLGGLGVATRTSYYEVRPNSPATANFIVHPRQTWAFASLGAGLDIGRMFIQTKWDQSIASEGPVLFPISLGVRF